MGRLEQKVALVTGAARGIGEAIAGAFVREGAQVLVSDIDEARDRRPARSYGARSERPYSAMRMQIDGGS